MKLEAEPKVERKIGTVSMFYRRKGFGFIKRDGEEDILVHFSNIVTDDPWPFIQTGTKVEYQTGDDFKGRSTAQKVTLAGGAKIPIFRDWKEGDRDNNDENVYTGWIDYYDNQQSHGYIKPDEPVTWKETTVYRKIHFRRDAVITQKVPEGMRSFTLPLNKKRVAFKVYRYLKDDGKYSLAAQIVVKENGDPFRYFKSRGGKKLDMAVPKRKRPRDQDEESSSKRTKTEVSDEIDNKEKTEEEKRILEYEKMKKEFKTKAFEEKKKARTLDKEDKTHKGRVVSWNPIHKEGIILPYEKVWFNGITITLRRGKLKVYSEDIVSGSKDVGLFKKMEVTFKVYADSVGFGAMEIRDIDGNPIIYKTGKTRAEEKLAKALEKAKQEKAKLEKAERKKAKAEKKRKSKTESKTKSD